MYDHQTNIVLCMKDGTGTFSGASAIESDFWGMCTDDNNNISSNNNSTTIATTTPAVPVAAHHIILQYTDVAGR